MKLGFIGLGTMGSRIARRLPKAGHQLVVHDPRRAAAEPLLTDGGVWADTPREVAAQVEVVFTSLPGPAEVEAVALGGDGILAGIGRGGAYFDLSTNSPSLVRRINAAFHEKSAHMLDAPVSGGPAGAASGKLALWVSGDEAIFQRYRPLLLDIGDQPRYIGPSGAGSVAKLVHNCAGYIVNTALAEVFTMGVKAGVDPLSLWEAVRHGALGRRRLFDLVTEHFLPGRYDPPNFALRLAHKDVSLATALGRELGVPMRLANLTLEEMTEALNRGWGDRDSRVAMLLEPERANVKVEVDGERLRAAIADAKEKG
jgi:3-hydroxyisobutyrate dehydrogenase-like beta-hydroxyacid dehydrogenase